MALNKQRILSELGSVMNQLQNADCGCMGKLFDQGQAQGVSKQPMCNQPTFGGCHHNHCHSHGCGGFSASSSNEPCSMNFPSQNAQSTTGHCMGHCNPPKLYSDTYGYLNENLMKPVVHEVYNDLKDITPANTVMNNPMANQMGLSSNMQGNTNNMLNTAANQGAIAHAVNPGNSEMNSLSGMGQQIVKMMMGENRNKPLQNQNAKMQFSNAPGQDHSMNAQKPHATNHFNNHPTGNMQTLAMNNMQNNASPANQIQNPNMTSQQRVASNQNYGQHTEGVSKFKQMFPGVMQGMGGDLGFDPMSIAIQMNPANRQQVAMDTIQQIMNGDKGPAMQNVMNGVNMAAQNLGQVNAVPAAHQGVLSGTLPQGVISNQESQMQNSIVAQGNPQTNNLNEQQVYPVCTGVTNMAAQGQTIQIPTPQSQLYEHGQTSQEHIQHSQVQNMQGQISQHQIPQTEMSPQALIPHSQINPNQPLAQQQSSIPQRQVIQEANQQQFHQNNMLEPIPETPTQLIPPNTQKLVKEPIFPVDTSSNIQYNTLGQPINLLPPKMYRPVIPNLPQTLSPQYIPKTQNDVYSNVKSTVSKTSLIGAKAVGKTPSRTQMQHLYNQYKGSQSFTQQNIRPDHGGTYSEGKLNVQQIPAQPRAMMEMVAGDTTANNQVTSEPVTKGDIQQFGDVLTTNKPESDVEKAPPMENKKGRNGLQDQVFPSYVTAAAWTFHGERLGPYGRPFCARG